MEHSCIQLDDLPDEILLIILKKLHNSDVLYSLIGVNKRLDTIVNDSIFTRNLILKTPFNGLSSQFTDTILDRFCFQILPKINEKIERLNVESSSMERILRTTNYPNLRTLGLYDLAPETAIDLFSNGSYLIRDLGHQISSLFINMKEHVQGNGSFEDENIFIFGQICMMFTNLQHLNFSSSSDYEQLTFGRMPSIEFSSNILELHVIIKSIVDCLCLLDDHFDQLHTLYITICPRRVRAWPPVNNQKKLPNLKCFSLIHEDGLMMYNEIFVPLVQRMSNLEELSLYFLTSPRLIIDGDHLKKNIINHMTKLNKFTFHICSVIRLDNQVNLPSNEDIENTFKNFKNNKIISIVDYFSRSKLFYCHIYSYPYPWTFYHNITNNFPGGLFKRVREISLHDERPFEHEFFLRIAKSFPFIEKLSLNNCEPQQNDNREWLIIEYPYLIKLDLIGAHENYVEQFLNNTKTCLLNNFYLRVRHDSLQKATDNFTRAATRINCSKVIDLVSTHGEQLLPKLRDYFPHAEIH